MSHKRSHKIGRFRRIIMRLKHRHGHGVHSPYIYDIVREVFMCRDAKRALESPLYRLLSGIGVKHSHACEIENLRHHCGFATFAVDSLESNDMVICSISSPRERIERIVALAKDRGTAVVILYPHISSLRDQMCDEIVDKHPSTTINRVGYLVIFNNHLPKQHFVL